MTRTRLLIGFSIAAIAAAFFVEPVAQNPAYFSFAVSEFGRQLGLAFQLRDDALDYEAAEADLGKYPLTDLREGKVTLPLLLTLKRCAPGEREMISSILKSAARLAECGEQPV